jgi:nitrogen fixation protein FixH
VTASFRRPAYEAEDQNVVLTPQADGSLSAPVELRCGIWIVDIHAEARLAHPYRDARRLTLRHGLVQ